MEKKNMAQVSELHMFTYSGKMKIGGFVAGKNNKRFVWITNTINPCGKILTMAVPIGDTPTDAVRLTKKHTKEKLINAGLVAWDLEFAEHWCQSLL